MGMSRLFDFATILSTPAASGPASLVLDSISAAAAFSVRKLRTAYAGSCLRVRRSSDSTEQDIGFSNNALDTSALTSFCGAGSGYGRYWYDQSGNAKNAGMATTANQARIVNSGVADAGFVFDGTNDHFTLTAIDLTDFSAFVVLKQTVEKDVIVLGRSDNNTQVFRENTAGAYSYYYGAEVISPQTDASFSAIHTIALLRANGGTSEFFRDGASRGTAGDGGPSTMPFSQFPGIIGTTYPQHLINGLIYELIVLPAAASASDRAAIQASQKAYFGTP